jgi:hypothetical protein
LSTRRIAVIAALAFTIVAGALGRAFGQVVGGRKVLSPVVTYGGTVGLTPLG